jgi:hypothetical protein
MTTLSPDAFSQGMTAIQDRWKPLQPATLAMYYARLRDCLIDAEFIAACALSLDLQQYHLPSPKQLMQLAHPEPSAKIEAEDTYNRLLHMCRCQPWQTIQSRAFSETTWRAIGAAGGLRAIALAEPQDAPHVKRRFVEAFIDLREHATRTADVHAALAAVDPRARALIQHTSKQIGAANG